MKLRFSKFSIVHNGRHNGTAHNAAAESLNGPCSVASAYCIFVFVFRRFQYIPPVRTRISVIVRDQYVVRSKWHLRWMRAAHWTQQACVCVCVYVMRLWKRFAARQYGTFGAFLQSRATFWARHSSMVSEHTRVPAVTSACFGRSHKEYDWFNLISELHHSRDQTHLVFIRNECDSVLGCG